MDMGSEERWHYTYSGLCILECKEVKKWMSKMNVHVNVDVAQRFALLGTTRILRNVLEM